MKRISIMTLPLLMSLLWCVACSENTPKMNVSQPDIEKHEIVSTNDTIPTIVDSICGIPALDYIMGKFDPLNVACFKKIPNSFTDKPDLYLRIEALEAYKQMFKAAKMDGIELVIISATRNFNYQKGIWDRKWSGKTLLEGKTKATDILEFSDRARAIMKYSAMPGASRHHWGTEIDINTLNNDWFLNGKGKKLYEWMQTKGKSFGFFQVYTSRSSGRSKGYEEEKWHYTYKPVSKYITKLAQQLLTDQSISGFAGSETAPDVNVKDNYIMGINPECYE